MSGGGEGKKAIWLITYCDMLTLLLVAFILLLAMAPKVSEKLFPKIFFPGQRKTDVGSRRLNVNRDAVVSRVMLPSGRTVLEGAEDRPKDNAPTSERVSEVLRFLEVKDLGTLADSHVLQVPFDLLFDKKEGRLSDSGAVLLQTIAYQLRPLPYDIHVEVASADVPKAVLLCQYLGKHAAKKKEDRISPDRLAVSIRDGAGSGGEWVWLTFVRQ